jgi:hypothetical protein
MCCFRSVLSIARCVCVRCRLRPSAQSIWQVVNELTLDGSEVEWLSAVRLRHLTTGQFLCLRCAQAADSPALQVLASSSSGGNAAVAAALSSATQQQQQQYQQQQYPHVRQRSAFFAGSGESPLPGDSRADCDDSSSAAAGRPQLVVATTRDATDPCSLFDVMPITTDPEGNTSGKAPVKYSSSLTLRHRGTKLHFSVASAAQTAAAHAPPVAAAPFLSPTAAGGAGRRHTTAAGAAAAAAVSSDGTTTAAAAAGAGQQRGSRGGVWWEYAGDRGLAPGCDDASSEVYRISPVSHDELRDVLHVLRHVTTLRAAVTEVSSNALFYCFDVFAHSATAAQSCMRSAAVASHHTRTLTELYQHATM